MRKLLVTLLLLALTPIAYSAVTVGSSTSSSTTGSGITFAHTASAGTTVLTCFVGWNPGNTVTTTATYNGLSMTSVATTGPYGSNNVSEEGFVLYSPPTGTSYNVVITLSSSVYWAIATCTDLEGTPTSAAFGTWATNGGTSTGPSSVSPTGALGNGLYIGASIMNSTTISSTGSNQTQLTMNAAGSAAMSADSIPGVDSGAFQWTAGGTVGSDWAALGASVSAAGGSLTPGILLSNGKVLLSNGKPVVSN